MLIVAVNLDPWNTQSANVKIPMKDLNGDLNIGNAYEVCDLLSGDRYTWTTDWNYVMLNPYEMPAHIFKIKTEKAEN